MKATGKWFTSQFTYIIFIYPQSSAYSSLHEFIWNHYSDQLLIGLLAQLIEHCTDIAEVMNSIPVQA